MAFAQQFFYIFACSAVKLSVLFYYKRIFITPSFKRISKFLIGVVIAWNITFFFASLFECLPIASNWDPTIPHQCIDLRSMFLAEGALDMVLDIAILCLPMPFIQNLRMDRRRKAAISAILSLSFL